jgi:hypothetical protein
MIPERHVLVFPLHRREINMALVLGRQLATIRARVGTARTAVEAHTVHGDVVDHCRVVDVGNMNATQIVDGTVVIEVVAAPIAPLETNTGVTVTVVDTTIEAYVRTPIARMPKVHTVTPAPVARRPQQARGRRQHPGAGHPVVVSVIPRPISGRPDVANSGAGRLDIHG